MARWCSISNFALMRGPSVVVVYAVSLMVPAPAAGDLNARWLVRIYAPSIVDITQVGGSVSFSLPNPPAAATTFNGTVDGSSLFASAATADPLCPEQLYATIAADENSFVGGISKVCPPVIVGVALDAQRCECFDGNSANGDGCDSECRIEACYSCSGEPSVCVPLADDVACDDHSACSSGESCTAAVCSGGNPVTPCVDITGCWRLYYDYADPSVSDRDHAVVFTQRDTALETAGMRGTITPASGSFSLTAVYGEVCGLASLSGLAAADGLTLTGTYRFPVRVSFSTCSTLVATVSGTRCGGGTLDSNEECDDGDATGGDGCDAECQVEPCFTCTGSPSVCTALLCPACYSCDGTGQCVVAPRSGCAASSLLSRTTLWVSDASTPADDALTWHWRRGAGSPLRELAQSTVYALCVYDESTSPPTTLISAPAQRVECPDSACWTSRRNGFSYRNPNGDNNGLTRIDLYARADGRAKIVVRGKGSFLNPPTAPLLPPLRVQLQAIDLGTNLQTCFEAAYTTPGVRTNDNGVFRARGTGS